MIFWIGLHHPNWLERTNVPAMVSHRALVGRKRLPRALGPWVQDSSGFTELDLYGEYRTSPRDYAAETQRRFIEIGNMKWAAIQDWMCEPQMVTKTGLSVAEHQRRTIDSWFDLNEIEPDLPWIPILQGWNTDDYLRHIDQWLHRGVDLLKAPIVGVGTVCKRQNTVWAAQLFRDLSALGICCHGFGLKITCIVRAQQWLGSADTTAWSFDGQMPLGGRCSIHRDHRQCSNCLDYALLYRQRLLNRLSQLMLPESGHGAATSAA